jgi:hypothetical protein
LALLTATSGGALYRGNGIHFLSLVPMTSSNTALSTIIQALVQSWTRQSIVCPPVALPYVKQVAAANGVVLPPDFVQLYRAANGTPELYPNHMDENYCSFLPVEALKTELKDWLVITAEAATLERVGVTVFVDFMHRSWEYGFIGDANGGDYRIGIMPGADEFKVLTTSLTTFLQWYVGDADALYDYSHPFTELGRTAQS